MYCIVFVNCFGLSKGVDNNDIIIETKINKECILKLGIKGSLCMQAESAVYISAVLS